MKDFLIVLIAVLILIIAIQNLNHDVFVENHATEITIDKENILPPVQNKITGKRESFNINGIDVVISKLYSYDITGKVVSTYDYTPTSTGNTDLHLIAPKDIAIVWGELAKPENDQKIKYTLNGNHGFSFEAIDKKWLSASERNQLVKTSSAVNLLVTDNTELLSSIKEIKVNDFVNIKGYLVDLYWNNGNGIIRTATEQSERTNNANVIFIEDIKWVN